MSKRTPVSKLSVVHVIQAIGRVRRATRKNEKKGAWHKLDAMLKRQGSSLAQVATALAPKPG